MTNKKIAIVINSLKIGGGAEKAAAALADGLKKRGHDVLLCLFGRQGDEYPTVADKEIVDGRLPKNSLASLAAIFSRGKKISSLCKDKKIDTVISFMEEANFAAVVSKIIFNNKARIICAVRNNPEKKKIVSRLLMKLFYPLADCLVANSLALERIIKVFSKRTAVVYNMVDYELAAAKSLEKLLEEDEKIFQEGPVFMNIGRLHPQKGQDVLLKAFSEVLKEVPAAKLVIIGEGERKEELLSLSSSLGISSQVFFLGRRINVFSLLRAASVFVLSSNWEGLPNVVLESLSVGTVVAATDCPVGVREIIAPGNESLVLPIETERGILTKTSDEKMLSSAMLAALKKERKVIIDERFMVEKVIDAWEKII